MTKKEKYNEIKKLIMEQGIKSIPDDSKNMKEVILPVEDHQDYMMRVSALLKVCALALDGQGSFTSRRLNYLTVEDSVTLVLEMVILLLPHDQMFHMDRIMTIMDPDWIKDHRRSMTFNNEQKKDNDKGSHNENEG